MRMREVACSTLEKFRYLFIGDCEFVDNLPDVAVQHELRLEWFEKHVRGRDYAWEGAPGDEEEEEAKTKENP